MESIYMGLIYVGCVIAFLVICREVICWYFKLSTITSQLEDIKNLLKKVVEKNKEK